MKRIKTLCAVLAVACGTGAVSATVAQASSPEVNPFCYPTSAGKYPSYLDCVFGVVGGHQWERLFSVFIAGESALRATGVTIACKADSGVAEFTGTTTLDATVTFEGCKGEILGGKCPETIKSDLVGTLGTVTAAEATSEVGLLLKAKSGAFSEFKCGSLTIKVEGSIAAEVAPVRELTSSGRLGFAVSGTSQKIKKITIEGKEEKPSLKAFGTAASLEATEEGMFSEAAEIT
jgi:hypothetical protein